MTSAPELIYDLALEAINLAMPCVESGATLTPFIMTPKSIISVVSDPGSNFFPCVQDVLNDIAYKTAFALTYDGYLTMQGSRNDAIFVEASPARTSQIFVFAQRYSVGKPEKPAVRIGNLLHLENEKSHLKITV